MLSVNVAELKRHLSKYLTLAKNGEEIVIRDRTLPVARLIPFTAENANKQELMLVAAGKLRLPAESVDLEQLLTVPSGRIIGRSVTGALLEERGQSR
jgi:antitoxin (DNA-binding transcriptional repressor) of toxin-antitoxin stability system